MWTVPSAQLYADLPIPSPRPATLKELRKKALDYYSDHLQGTSVTNKQLGAVDFDRVESVDFTGAGKREVKHTSAKEEKLLLVKHLRSLIQNASDITEENAKKDRLIYSNSGLGVATTSNSSAVSRPRSENVGATKGVRPTSDKSSGSSTHILPHEQKEGTKNLDSV